jgi:hypothetical protein
MSTFKGGLISYGGAFLATLAATVAAAFLTGNSAPQQQSSVPVSLPSDLAALFVPSGWMGDAQVDPALLSYGNLVESVHGRTQVATRFSYARGPKGWAGVYWQFPDSNWADKPGRDLTGAKRITFAARGERGGEVVEFKSGGTTGAVPDSFMRSLGNVPLASEWKRFTLDLEGADLSNVVGGFAWVAVANRDGAPVTFYLAELSIE